MALALGLGKSFGAPGYRIGSLGNIPRRAAISVTSRYIIVCPTRVLWRGVKPDITYVNSGTEGHAERLNRAIEVLVIKRVLVVPDSSRRIGYFVAHEPDAIDTRIGLDLVHCCAPVQAWMAGCIRTVLPTGEKVKFGGVPLTEN